ncbi:hypothetical protein AB6A40_005033 [Gnathostoma spinigerum]|uniref:Uncharacterized protein n=1 Tax=Gnathostoma spinigerum TaxID=75299 RepID=A0ABD6EJJ6_9BILA
MLAVIKWLSFIEVLLVILQLLATYSLVVEFFSELRFLSILGSHRNLVSSFIGNLGNDDVPHLRYLRLYHAMVPEEVLRRMLLRRKNLIINPRRGYILTFTVHNGDPQFNDTFTGNMNLLENDLLEEPGFCCL